MGQMPRHIAIIMDGNGRWAERRKHNRIFGHTRGVERAREITRECAKMGVGALTLYTFSTENWQRPLTEVNFLMKLLLRYLKNETQELVDNNLRFQAIGFLDMLPVNIQQELERVRKATEKNTGMQLNVALSYGSRQEIFSAIKSLVEQCENGSISSSTLQEEHFTKRLFTANCPELDLVIRTGGDQRISNFLLWQAAYAELYFTDKCWPDFEAEDIKIAVESFGQRERRFGRINPQ